MDNKLFAINIIYAVADTFISALAIIAFSCASFYFSRWWILLLNIIPIVLFNSHSLIINQDLAAAQEGEDTDS